MSALSGPNGNDRSKDISSNVNRENPNPSSNSVEKKTSVVFDSSLQDAQISGKKHYQWCQERAIKYLDTEGLQYAKMSFLSDMGKHPKTAINELFFLIVCDIQDPNEFKDFIKGFTHVTD